MFTGLLKFIFLLSSWHEGKAMAYSIGSATSQNDLIQQLAAWLVMQGWTLDTSQADGSGWRAHLHKSGNYVHFRALPTGDPFDGHHLISCTVPFLACYMSTAYAGSDVAWFASTTGAPLGTDGKVCGSCIVVNPGANAAFHFFNDGNDNYTIVVERNTGVCQILGFGFSVTKHGGNWTGGAYLHGHFSGGDTGDNPLNDNSLCPFYYGSSEVGNNGTSYVRADIDSFTNNWVAINPTTYARGGWTGKRAYGIAQSGLSLPGTIPHTVHISGRTVSSINNQAVLLPIKIYADRDEGGPCLIATVPSVYECQAVWNGYLFGAEIQLGADTYKLFPHCAVKKVA
jgi:hypothetical protein